MRFIKLVALAFIAALAAGAMMSSTASAVLGISECTKESTASFNYTEAACLTTSSSETGEFEEREIAGATFTGKALGRTILTSASKAVECSGATESGVITSRTEG